MANKKKSSIIKWIIIGVAIIALGIGGFFGYKAYGNYLANKVYAPNDNVGFPDFDIKVTKAEFKNVDLPIDKDTVKKYGAIDKKENCDTMSKENTYWKAWDGDINAPWVKYGPSDFNICIRRNDSRDAITKYTSENKQLVVDYLITAKNNVNAKDVSIALEPDSGRKLDTKVDAFNANQFFELGAQYTLPDGLAIGAPGPVYTSEHPQNYTPFHKSELGGNINTGIERRGNLYTDIRNSESSIDLKITYHGQTRIVRITH